MKKFIIISILFLLLPVMCLGAETKNTTALEIVRPTVRIFNPLTGELEKEFYPFDENSTVLGVNIAVCDLNSDGFQEIIVAS